MLANIKDAIIGLKRWLASRFRNLVFLRIQLLIAIASLALFMNRQTQEVLLGMASNGLFHQMILVNVLTALLCISLWHSSRKLSLMRYRSPSTTSPSPSRSAWTPRILGVIPSLSLSIAMFIVFVVERPRLDPQGNITIAVVGTSIWFVVTMLQFLVLCLIFSFRRKLPDRLNFFTTDPANENGIFAPWVEILAFSASWATFAFFAIPNSIYLSSADLRSGVSAVVVIIGLLLVVMASLLSWADSRWRRFVWILAFAFLVTIIVSSRLSGSTAGIFMYPRLIGAVNLALIALLISVIILSTIYKWSHHNEIPLITLAVGLFYSFGFIGWNDNHFVRKLQTSTAPESSSEQIKVNSMGTYFDQWKKQNLPPDSACTLSNPCPIYVVAAQGGGIYAAYHAARVLAVLNDATNGLFHKHLFAISGVSGGSVGAASFTAIDSIKELNSKEKIGELSRYLKTDLLSPLLALGLFGDSIQGLLPIPISVWNRALGLEFSLESGFAESVEHAKHSEDISSLDGHKVAAGIESFMSSSLYQSQMNGKYPTALVFNTTSVENGSRFLIAPFQVKPDEFGGVQAGDPVPIRHSTAAILSARFPIVTSYGELNFANSNPSNKPKLPAVRLVDGGYYDNSGLITAQQIRTLIREHQCKPMRPACVYGEGDRRFPVVLISLTDLRELSSASKSPETNNDSDYAVTLEKRLADSLDSLFSPVAALWKTRQAKTDQLLADLEHASKETQDGSEDFLVIQLAKEAVVNPSQKCESDLAPQSSMEPSHLLRLLRCRISTSGWNKNRILRLPLGWSISDVSAHLIDQQVRTVEEVKKVSWREENSTDKNVEAAAKSFDHVRDSVRRQLMSSR